MRLPLGLFSGTWCVRNAVGNGLRAVGLAAFCVWVVGCKPPPPSYPRGSVERTGFLAGFAPGKTSASGETLYFEPSALVRSGDAVLIANDKPLPGLSTLLSVPLQAFDQDHIDSEKVTFVRAEAFEKSSKLESFAASAPWFYAAGDFDRISVESAQNDSYNNLLAWPAGFPERARIICASERGGVVSSRELRAQFTEALKSQRYPDGPPYFKIEALVAPDPRTLIFGVREMGIDYEQHEYSFTLVEATMHEDASGVSVPGSFRKVLDFLPVIPERPEWQLGLSSLEFDPELQVFVAVTSYESDEDIGACLWVFSPEDLKVGKPPRLVRDASGQPLLFSHKVEGLVALGGGRFLMISDDDQVLKTSGRRARAANEAVYFVVRVEPFGK